MDESGKASEQSSIRDPNVLVRGSGAGFSQEIIAGSHRLTADEPVAAGGTDIGPTPYDLLLAALGACTSMTVGMYARRKKWPLAGIVVRLRHSKIHAEDFPQPQSRKFAAYGSRIWEGLAGPAQEIAQKVFQCLTEQDAAGRLTRRPTRLSDLVTITGAHAVK
jgi:uncharacterized OsmC-like protein